MLNKQKENLFLIIWILVITLFFSLSDSKLIPYIIPVFPPLAILAARGLLSALDGKGRRILFINIFNAALFVILCIGAAVILSGKFNIKNVDMILPYKNLFLSVCITGLIFSALGFFFAKKRKALLVLYCVFAFVFTALAKPAFAIVGDQRSAKQLTQSMLEYLNKDDIVVMFDGYRQDIPFYLERRLVLVNFTGELAFGISKNTEPGWIYNTQNMEELITRPLMGRREEQQGIVTVILKDQKMYFIVPDNRLNDFAPFKNAVTFVEHDQNDLNVFVRK